MGCGACSQIALALIGEPIFDPARSYAVGDYVVYLGVLYRNTVEDNQGNTPNNPGSGWTATTVVEELRRLENGGEHDVALLELGYLPWSSEFIYPVNVGVQHNGYICIANEGSNTSEPPPNPGTKVQDPVTYQYWNVFATFETYQRYFINSVQWIN
jgi:hypothetical protein